MSKCWYVFAISVTHSAHAQSGSKVGTKPRSCHTDSCFVNIFNRSREIHLFHWLAWLHLACAVRAPYALPAVCHPHVFHFFLSRLIVFTDPGCFIPIGRVGCLSRALYRGIGFLLEQCPSWLYLSHCERLTALPAPRVVPAPLYPAPRKEGGNGSSRMCHFQSAAKLRCYVTSRGYPAGFVVVGK